MPGIAGGGSYAESGSGSTYLCLPHDPDFAPSNFPSALYNNGQVARVWGAEYQYSYGNVKGDDDVTCAACLDTKAVTSMMIPGKALCPSGWRKQYSGYISVLTIIFMVQHLNMHVWIMIHNTLKGGDKI